MNACWVSYYLVVVCLLSTLPSWILEQKLLYLKDQYFPLPHPDGFPEPQGWAHGHSESFSYQWSFLSGSQAGKTYAQELMVVSVPGSGKRCSDIIRLTAQHTERQGREARRQGEWPSHVWTLAPVSADRPLLLPGLLAWGSVDQIFFELPQYASTGSLFFLWWGRG